MPTQANATDRTIRRTLRFVVVLSVLLLAGGRVNGEDDTASQPDSLPAQQDQPPHPSDEQTSPPRRVISWRVDPAHPWEQAQEADQLQDLVEDDGQQQTPSAKPAYLQERKPSETLQNHENDDGAEPDRQDGNEAMNEMIASDKYVQLEERLEKEGLSLELVDELRELALDDQEPDVFAMVRYAEAVLFESQSGPPDVGNFSEALELLDIAAEVGFVAAQTTLSMFDLVGFGKPPPSNANASWENYKHNAIEDLLNLADQNDFVASLVVGYRIWNGTLNVTTGMDQCNDALVYYHRCAEDNIFRIAEKGGEKPLDYTRLSEKILGTNDFEDFENDPGKLEYYRSLASSPGNEMYAEASQRLGEMYFFGDEAAQIPRDQAEAAQHFRHAADAGEPHAQANIGMMYANGMGVAQDNETAIKYFRMAADQDNGFAYHGLGFMYLTGSGVAKNETKAIELFEKAVELGHFDSHTYLGNAYLQGQGVPVDLDKSFEHFRLASESQSSQSIFNLGVMHYRGAGTPQSCEIALDHFRRVAVNPEALDSLPFSLSKGLQSYERQDYLRAYLNFRLVAEFGSEAAQCNAAYLLESHSNEIFAVTTSSEPSSSSSTPSSTSDAPAQEGAEEEPSASDTHERFSDFWWFAPNEVPLQQALTLYTQAARLNDSEAMRKVGICHYEAWQDACSLNKTLAMDFYAQAAERGDSEAAYRSGVMYTMGDGVGRNLPLALASFDRCSNAEFPENVPCAILLFGLSVATSIGGLLGF